MAKPPIKTLRDVLGDGRVESRGAGVVVRPASVDALSQAVEAVGTAGCTMAAGRHGEADVRFDLADLDRIVEINERDRFVVVEAGCSWRALVEALSSRRLRVPVMPLVDGAATVGASVSTNGHFFGSGRHGTLADTVLSLDVVLASGDLVETGAAAAEGRTPFMRHFGPDLMGVFLGDAGAFGIKARVTLPLIPEPGTVGGVSFAFERFEDVAEAHVAVSREGLVSEAWALDPDRNDALAARGHRSLESVSFNRNGAIPLRGDRARAAAAPRLVDGHRIVQRGGWSFHAVVEGDDERAVETRKQQVRRLLAPAAIRELPPAVAEAVRTRPFDAGPELLVNRHPHATAVEALFPASRAAELAAVTDEYFLRHAESMARSSIAVAVLTGGAGLSFSIAATVSWAKDSAATRRAGQTLLNDLAILWGAFGASYHRLPPAVSYQAAVSSAAGRFAASVKRALDPHNLMAPAALGLGAKSRDQGAVKFAEFPQDLLRERLR
jgi:FAD/FMN-containing dehydrogenase